MLSNFFQKQNAPNRIKDKLQPEQKFPGTGAIISVINQKGGCGKTTTVINLAACLAELGNKVLIIDCDPQGHATLGLGLKINDNEHCLYHALVNPRMHLSTVIRHSYHDNLHMIPSSSLLASAQIDLINIIGRETLLRQKINTVAQNYNFIIIDCPPSLNLLTLNALVAASKLIIPIQTHFYSLDGMSELFKTIEVIRHKFNPDLSILGILPTLFDKRTKVNHQVLKAVKDYFQGNIKIFDSIIHSCTSLTESPIYGKPIIQYRPKSRGAADYNNLTKEILALDSLFV
ncbi:MAG: AAA family ATPase [Candidatus Omnitrophica bacterium]|nr:AAA family ATPase [Candidatus Omnitrophota bacterium]